MGRRPGSRADPAVRSSATAEDQPDASFAGQHDTVLGVEGIDGILAAVAKCWDSLHNARAVAYREAHDIDPADVRMAVIVQRMVDPALAGVLFTANPLTGCRTEMLVDAAPGLGTAVVDGSAGADHYVLGKSVPPHLTELREAGERLQDHFGCPQDVEWAIDRDGMLWLLQSRPITTLFPLPPATEKPLPRVYVEFGNVQGMLQPVTPMGMATLRAQIAGMLAALGVRAEIVDIGGRLYGDLTDLARSRTARKRLVKLLAVDFGPRAQAAMEHVLADPRFAPVAETSRAANSAALGTAVRAVKGILRSLARPEAARLLGTPPAELAARYRHGSLPELGLGAFLEAYGHRGTAEVDLGVPRWAEDPTPLFATIANYLRVTDPEQAPDRRFAAAAATAEATLREIARRARRRPVRGGIAVFLLRRARALAGLREAGKFAGLYRLRAMRHELLLIGAELAAAGRIEQPGDIMFLTLEEVRTAVHDGGDPRPAVAARKAVHRREMRRRTVPVALLSDGTDVETVLPAAPATAGVLTGVGAAAGRVTGPARVVTDPATARVEPGEILVAPTTDPGWTPLFLTAGALVTETGAIMAHGPTVAREYGIPAVISVPDATRRIATGQVVTVDGAAGTVTIGTPAL
ncbi:PEP/pyruvate-binding domain-containing protein [Actinoplanes sp. NPDC051475]|uniref:PEP/pyruvate-binding domain-containing protein n=1 Tax=Actinoplanes sp. NPDC051475 TaxID=3157225 RepID=UPI00344D9685